MASGFTWLDYSDGERRRVLDVVRSLSEHDTRDELGLATVRDSLADLLAPGISTLQARPRYFLFVPWIYQGIEARVRTRSASVTKDWITRKARNAEVELIDCLLEAGESAGVIGSWSGKALKRLPSSIYWSGLEAWGMRLCPWSIDRYHHRLAVYGPPARTAVDDACGAWPNWNPGLPPAPDGFPEGATMELTPPEAEYLRDRILEKQPNTLLGQLVLGGDAVADLDYPWSALDHGIEIAPGVARVVRHAREFSVAMHGAVLVYNLMLAEAHPAQREDWVQTYRDRIADWVQEVRHRWADFAAWDRAEFWRTVEGTGANIPLRTRRFVNAWLDRLLSAADPASMAGDASMRSLIDNRERELKRAQARLHNPRLLEIWNGDTGSGVGRMNYRWPVMRQHLADIHAGLVQPAEAAHA